MTDAKLKEGRKAEENADVRYEIRFASGVNPARFAGRERALRYLKLYRKETSTDCWLVKIVNVQRDVRKRQWRRGNVTVTHAPGAVSIHAWNCGKYVGSRYVNDDDPRADCRNYADVRRAAKRFLDICAPLWAHRSDKWKAR